MTNRWRRVGGAVGRVALGLGLAVVVWLVALQVRAQKSPEPLYTTASVTPSPPAASNGWTLVLAGLPKPPEVPRPVLGLVAPGTRTADDGRGVTREAEGLRQLVTSAPAQATLAALGAALDRPVFADACPLDLATDCPILPLYRAHQLEELAILDRARDAPAEAAARLVRLMRADAGWVGSARSVVSLEVAVASARRSQAVATMLAPRLSPESRAALARAVDGVRQTPVSVERPLVVEYLHARQAIDLVGADARALRLSDPSSSDSAWGGRVVSALWLDRGRTQSQLADRTRAWVTWVGQPLTVTPPTDATYTDQPLFWLENPVGKFTLDGTRLPPSLWTKVRLEIGALQGESDTLATSLRADEPGR